MFEIRKIDLPIEVVDCENCGCRSESIMEIIISPTVIINGKDVKTNNERHVRLCEKCRCELGKILLGNEFYKMEDKK